MWTVEIWLGTRRSSADANTAQMALSMCSSRYCSTFAPIFFLYFWVVVIFWDSLTFSFYFFDIFSSLTSTKEVTTKNMSLNKWNAWPMEISEDVRKIDKKFVTTKRWSCDQFLAKIKFFEPGKTGDERFSNRFWYMERRNSSSFVKTRPVLRTNSEVEAKTGTMLDLCS